MFCLTGICNHVQELEYRLKDGTEKSVSVNMLHKLCMEL